MRAHTADVILEAFGPDLPACCEEAVAALVELFADAERAELVGSWAASIPAGGPEEVLLALLEEVIFVLDTSDGVPVSARVQQRPDGGLDAVLALASPASVASTGAVPKAVSRSGLEVRTEPGRVGCSVLVDV
ncbi:MAG TPA: archease [Acidimicrobiales bacterium]|nr:archease [Acidimicrobiales bacterium]